jgi:hypothetical protein
MHGFKKIIPDSAVPLLRLAFYQEGAGAFLDELVVQVE